MATFEFESTPPADAVMPPQETLPPPYTTDVRRSRTKGVVKGGVAAGVVIGILLAPLDPTPDDSPSLLGSISNKFSAATILYVTKPEPPPLSAKPFEEPQPSAYALKDIPPKYLELYKKAAEPYPYLVWTDLAGIGRIETNHGRGWKPVWTRLPGITHGQNKHGCCAGPMQFYNNRSMTGGKPTTWDKYGKDYNKDGKVNIYDPGDAIPAAAKYLVDSGMNVPVGKEKRCKGGSGTPAERNARFSYNRACWYGENVYDFKIKYTG